MVLSEKKRKEKAHQAAIIGLGGAMAANTAAVIPTALTFYGARGNAAENNSFLKNLEKKHGVSFGMNGVPSNLHSAYNPFSGRHGSLNLIDHPPLPILAHEAGHGIHLGKGSTLRKGMHMASRMAGPTAGIGAGFALASSKDEKKRKWAPAAFAAGHAPLLYQETRANVHAFKEIRRQLGTKRALKALGMLAPAYATYAALPAGMYIGAKHVLKDGHEKKGFACGFRRVSE